MAKEKANSRQYRIIRFDDIFRLYKYTNEFPHWLEVFYASQELDDFKGVVDELLGIDLSNISVENLDDPHLVFKSDDIRRGMIVALEGGLYYIMWDNRLGNRRKMKSRLTGKVEDKPVSLIKRVEVLPGKFVNVARRPTKWNNVDNLLYCILF